MTQTKPAIDDERIVTPHAALIGLSGFARSGKDATAAILARHRGARRYALADALRDHALSSNIALPDGTPLTEVIDAFGWEGAKSSAYASDVRQILQRVGNDLRGDDPGFWIRRLTARLNAETPLPTAIVITDVRYRNEAQWVVDNGGSMWRIERPGVSAANNHVSEHDLSDWPFEVTIRNDGDLDLLRTRVIRTADGFSENLVRSPHRCS